MNISLIVILHNESIKTACDIHHDLMVMESCKTKGHDEVMELSNHSTLQIDCLFISVLNL